MGQKIRKIAIIGQGLIGSSITRAIFQRDLPYEVTITDGSRKVCERLLELGLGRAKVVFTSKEAVRDADLVIGCIPVASYASLVEDIAPHLKPGCILSDVGSVKGAVIEQSLPFIPDGVHFVPAHPLAGTEFSGPDAGKPKLFVDRWCILTPQADCDETAVGQVRQLWQEMGSKVAIMTPEEHDHTLAITSHLPHLSAFSIFHTAKDRERKSGTPVIEYSAGTFRDHTRVALSNPQMWRDIFMLNRHALREVFEQFVGDMRQILDAVDAGDQERLETLISESRQMRSRNINEQDYTKRKAGGSSSRKSEIIRPYSSD